MADTKVSALTQNTAPLGGDLLYQVDDPSGSPTGKKMTIGDVSIANAPPQGGLINGYISRTVSSSNLTIAIKTTAGSDPSSTDPVYCRIGNSVRRITSALSVTKNAGTNWFRRGGTGLATIAQKYYVYIGYNSTDGVTVGFSPVQFGRLYSDFSTTSTNETYCAISTITNATSADEYEQVGMFNATLSAGAGYTWSVPATSIVISRPVFDRIDKRVTTITSSATPTINTDICDFVDITALGTTVTSMTSGLSGTPRNGQSLIIRFKDDGTGRSITWGASYEALGVSLPTTTTASKRMTVGFLYDTTSAKWGCVAYTLEA